MRNTELAHASCKEICSTEANVLVELPRTKSIGRRNNESTPEPDRACEREESRVTGMGPVTFGSTIPRAGPFCPRPRLKWHKEQRCTSPKETPFR
jgi:hypothetical protein